MSKHRKGTAKRNRGCGLCKPHRKAGNGGAKFDRKVGARTANVRKYTIIWIEEA
jgi:hypothetical protein